jgi:hypothetical protein
MSSRLICTSTAKNDATTAACRCTSLFHLVMNFMRAFHEKEQAARDLK